MQPSSPIPSDFAEMLARVLIPGEEDAVAAVLNEAFSEFDDARLAAFLESFAARVRDLPEPVSAADLRTLLDAIRPPLR